MDEDAEKVQYGVSVEWQQLDPEGLWQKEAVKVR